MPEVVVIILKGVLNQEISIHHQETEKSLINLLLYIQLCFFLFLLFIFLWLDFSVSNTISKKHCNLRLLTICFNIFLHIIRCFRHLSLTNTVSHSHYLMSFIHRSSHYIIVPISCRTSFKIWRKWVTVTILAEIHQTRFVNDLITLFKFWSMIRCNVKLKWDRSLWLLNLLITAIFSWACLWSRRHI